MPLKVLSINEEGLRRCEENTKVFGRPIRYSGHTGDARSLRGLPLVIVVITIILNIYYYIGGEAQGGIAVTPVQV